MSFSDVHLQLHSIRATALQAEAAAHRCRPRPQTRHLRLRLGWLLVELGLRLVEHPTRAALVRPV